MKYNQRLNPSPQTVFQAIGETSVLLNLATETYYGLDETGTRFWQLMMEYHAWGPVFDRMAQEYLVDPDRLDQDLTRLIAELKDHNLIEVEAGTGGTQPA